MYKMSAAVNNELLVAIIHADLEASLFETGDLLQKGCVETLECTWIRALGMLGECVRIGHIREYQGCILAVHGICKNEVDVSVEDAFLATTRLSLLAKKFEKLYVRPSMPKMRDTIHELFPENGHLSEHGLSMFKSLLPDDSEERLFVVRILAGFTKLWADKDYDGARLAIEYISRKKLNIAKPKWILPSVLDDHDIVWILWGAVSLYAKDTGNQYVATCFDLFCTHYNTQSKYKTKMKQDRIGLLWSIFYQYSCSYSSKDDMTCWTKEDQGLYIHVMKNVASLWKQIVPTTSVAAPSSKKCGGGRDGMQVLLEYVPRGSVCQTIPVPSVKEEIRSVKVKDGDETGRIHTRDRRFYSCE
jgi:hypothetical protein